MVAAVPPSPLTVPGQFMAQSCIAGQVVRFVPFKNCSGHFKAIPPCGNIYIPRE